MNQYHNYIFLNEINDQLSVRIKKFKIVSIIYYIDDFQSFNENNCKRIRNFCKSISAPFYVVNSIKNALKYNATGIYIKADNKRIILKKYNKLKIIGTAHNNLEYFFKKNQNCDMIMLSPLFYNKKYSNNNILGTAKFRLISKGWKIDVCALGGINKTNINKVKLTKTNNIAFRSMIYSF
jgi:thiamine-phosphate pyrophosphorylase